MATIVTRAGKGAALTHQEVDANFTGLNTELGQKEVASNKGVANGYASLDVAGKVPAAQLPSYVDDVVEVANFASLPGTGETGKIYVTIDTNKTYRWTGSTYIEISASPGSTDSLAEGSTNLYFTQARARASLSASGSLNYNSSTGVVSFTDAVTSVAGRTGAVTLTSSDVGLGSVENKSSATIRGELTSGNVTTALGYTPYNATNPSGYITSSASITGTAAGITGYTLADVTGTATSVMTRNGGGDSAVGSRLHFTTCTADGGNFALVGLNWGGAAGTYKDFEVYDYPNSRPLFRAFGSTRNFEVFGALTVGGNTALHAANYNSYSPTLTGTGASGTWGINVTGNAATVSSITSGQVTGALGFTPYNATNPSGYITSSASISGSAGSAPLLSALGNYVWSASTLPGSYSLGIQCSFVYSGWQSYGSVMTMNTYSGGGSALQMYVPYSPTYGGTGLQVRFGNYDVSNGNAWTAWKTLLASDNYNSYSPTLTGTGASGTWGISITGNAATATSATSAIRLTFNDGPRDLSDRFPNSFTRTVNFDFVGAGAGNGTGNYAGVMTFSPWTGTTASTGDSSYQLAFANNSGVNASGQPRLSIRNGIDTTWNAWYTLLHSGNYSSYALPLSGGTLSGAITVTGGTNSIIAQDNGGSGDWRGRIISRNSTYDRAAFLGNYQGIAGVFAHNHALNAWADLYVNTVDGSGGGTVRMPSSVLVNGSQVLHAGNYSSYALPLSGGTMTGAIYVGTTGSGSATRALRVGPSGGNPGSFGSYSGSWRSTIEIWDNAATRMLHLTPPDGTNYNYSSIKSTDAGLKIDVGATGGTNAVTIETTGAVTLTSSLTMSAGGIASNAWSSSTPNEAVRVFAPHGGSASWDGVITGAIKIRLPNRASNSMWNMTVKIYDYDGSVAQYQIGNYAYSAGGYQSAASFVGSGSAPPRTVRIGNDGTYDCVWIGETGSTWSYPVVAVTEFFAGFRGGNSAAWANNWNVSYATSLGTVATTITPTVRLAGGSTINGDAILHASNYSSYALPLSGGTLTGTIYSNAASIIIGQQGGSTRGYLYNDSAGMGFLTSGGSWAAYVPLGTNNWQVNGSITASGNVTAYSDERVKANWRQLDDGFVVKLAGVKSGIYDRTDIELTQAGVSAQSLRDVLPQTVMESSDGELSVAYGNAALVSAVELAKELVALKHKVAELEARVH